MALLSVFVLAAAAATAAVDPKPGASGLSFGADVEMVNLTVSVVDQKERFVTGLDDKDFVVFEDGVPQQLSFFSREEDAVSLIIMIDMSSSMGPYLRAARLAATKFVRTLRPQDEAQLIEFSDRMNMLHDFSSDQEALVQSMRHRTRVFGSTALHNTLYVTLKEVIRQPRDIRRRRALILLSDGEDTSSMVTDEQVLELARTAEVGIYGIMLSAAAKWRPGYPQARYLLSALSHESGGGVYFPVHLSDLESVYGRIAQELRCQYNLGYVSANAKRDGKWRQILVASRQRGDVTLRHRLGYYARPNTSGVRRPIRRAAPPAEGAPPPDAPVPAAPPPAN
jgi:Ca-activated chloride channel homolog